MQNGTMQAGDVAKLFGCNVDKVAKYLEDAGIGPAYVARFGRGSMKLYDRQAVVSNSQRIADVIQRHREQGNQKRLAAGEKGRASLRDKRSQLTRIEQRLDKLCEALGVK